MAVDTNINRCHHQSVLTYGGLILLYVLIHISIDMVYFGSKSLSMQELLNTTEDFKRVNLFKNFSCFLMKVLVSVSNLLMNCPKFRVLHGALSAKSSAIINMM